MSNEALRQQAQQEIARGTATGERVLVWDPKQKRLVIKDARDVRPEEALRVGPDEATVSA